MRVATALLRALVVCAIGAWGVGTAAAQPAAPPAGYTIDPEFTQVSTDGAITIEQYLNKDTDDDWKWQFWVRRQATFSGLYLPGRSEMDRSPAEDRLWRTDALTLSCHSARHRCREQEAARRPGMGLLQDPPGVAENREAARVSRGGGSPEGA
jgi:hypothetical protein